MLAGPNPILSAGPGARALTGEPCAAGLQQRYCRIEDPASRIKIKSSCD